ncbi:MAG: beta-glucuronidase [Tannerellaceae bacterium]|nr:beta-glucuronidase [Tannerellaceae bacterium]
MRNLSRGLTVLLFLFLFISVYSQNPSLDLAGEWNFRMDSMDVGIKEKWFLTPLEDRICLPGSMTENYKGEEVTLHTPWTASIYDSSFFYNPRLEKFRRQDNLKLPFWLTPVKYYAGAAWYQKEVNIPSSWKKDRVLLFLERPHTETMVWVNGKEVGMQNSLSIPHQYEITSYLKSGKNNITIRIDNRTKDIDVGKDSHSITDQTQGNWNGVVGKIELRTTPKTYIEDVQVYPDIHTKTAKVKVNVVGTSSGMIKLEARSFNGEHTHAVQPLVQTFKASQLSEPIELDLWIGEEMQLWDEFHPNLYNLKVTVETGNKQDVREVRFGMREFTIRGKYFYINGRKTMLRGTVENCVFPLTGYAPMDVESWERVFRICREWGLNHMRFHSFCPPEAAFIAADRVGFYLQPEGPSWPNHGISLGDGYPIDEYLLEETKRLTKEYGNYASYCMLACGNEPRGRWVPWVSDFVDYWKATDPRRVYTGASVGNSWAWQPNNQFHVKAGARGVAWDQLPESGSDYRSRIDTVQQPYVSHETGQWCVFPDFSEIKKYTGVMRARNFELFREDLSDRNMGELAADFLMASGKLQALTYKHEIEKTFRTPDYAGFQLLSLNDYSGQGTALVGLLNAFWEEKGYITSSEFREFCAPTVLLSRMEKFVFITDETLTAGIEISHFGEKPLLHAEVQWKIKDPYGKILAQGSLDKKDIGIGNCQHLGTISYPLTGHTKAGKFILEVGLPCSKVVNHWDFWVYPSELPQVNLTNIHITDTLDEQTRSILQAGGNVLLLPAGKVKQGKEVVQYMTPAFWNTSWFKMRPPHTVGTLINNYHPVFRDFPTDTYTGLQWWELIHEADVMEMTNFPAAYQPVIQPIDTWFINRKLGMLFEANVGKGKIIVCSVDLTSGLDHRPVARQLYYSILTYMNSHRFVPEHSLDLSLIEDLMKEEGERLHTHTQDAPDELKNIVH